MNFRILFFSIAIGLFMVACEEYEDIVGYDEYLIKKDRHYAKENSFNELKSTTLIYDVIL